MSPKHQIEEIRLPQTDAARGSDLSADNAIGAVEHVGFCPLVDGQQAPQVYPSQDLPCSGVDACYKIGLPDVGKHFTLNELEFVQVL